MILEPNGALKLMPASYYDGLDREQLRVWCHWHARYGLPTIELVDYLKGLIGHKTAIEIGSGCGDLCYHLGIQGTDNWCQTFKDVQLFYILMRQPMIKYGSWVERIDALEAVQKYRPQVVVASWVTHWVDATKPVKNDVGNMYGVKEDEILKLVETYILIGNKNIHEYKPIMERDHLEIQAPFVKSRAQDASLDRIFIWRGDASK